MIDGKNGRSRLKPPPTHLIYIRLNCTRLSHDFHAIRYLGYTVCPPRQYYSI